MFDRYDADGSGTISASELGNVLAEMGHACTDDELAQILEEIDADNSGEIDFSEFLSAITGKVSSLFSDLNRDIEESVFGASMIREQGQVLATDQVFNPNLLCGLLLPTSGERDPATGHQAALDLSQILCRSV
jgi:hypothetical protein